MTDPLELSFTVGCSPEHAFEAWTVKTSLWWPTQHSFSGERGIEVRFEPFVGGRIYERTRSGVEHEWGEILAWEPPRKLVFLWHLATDRADATEVEVTFGGSDLGTEVAIIHRGWERLSAKGSTWRERNVMGWDGVLPHYRGFLDREGVPVNE